jgi:hypothetical protein
MIRPIFQRKRRLGPIGLKLDTNPHWNIVGVKGPQGEKSKDGPKDSDRDEELRFSFEKRRY